MTAFGRTNVMSMASLGVGAARSLDKRPVAAGTLEGVDLELGLLVGGGDAGIAEHRRGRDLGGPAVRAACGAIRA
jgi:hypothetical protein